MESTTFGTLDTEWQHIVCQSKLPNRNRPSSGQTWCNDVHTLTPHMSMNIPTLSLTPHYLHGVRLAAGSLAIGKDGGVVPTQDICREEKGTNKRGEGHTVHTGLEGECSGQDAVAKIQRSTGYTFPAPHFKFRLKTKLPTWEPIAGHCKRGQPIINPISAWNKQDKEPLWQDTSSTNRNKDLGHFSVRHHTCDVRYLTLLGN